MSCTSDKYSNIITINNNMQNASFIVKDTDNYYFSLLIDKNKDYICDDVGFFRKGTKNSNKVLNNKILFYLNRIDKYITGIEIIQDDFEPDTYKYKLFSYNIITDKYKYLDDLICNTVQYYNDTIYYMSDYNTNVINTIKADGSNIGKIDLEQKIVNFLITESSIIYLSKKEDNEELYMCDLYGKNTIFINKLNADQSKLIYHKNYIYYSNYKDYNRIYRININKKLNEKITDVSSTTFNICKNIIYFNNFNDKSKLYCMDINKKVVKKISDDTSLNCICVIDNKVFYKFGDEYNIADKNEFYINYINEDGSVHKFY